MRVTLLQTALHWEDPVKNRVHFDVLIDPLAGTTDLIILPEMFTTGFSMNPEKVAEANGTTLAWMKQKANATGACVTGSVAVQENNAFYNRLYWVAPGGATSIYDKRHLFRMAKEDAHYTAGTKKIISVLKDFKFCPLVCYDLRFPVWSRNRWRDGQWDYDVLIYVANWPEVRSYPWKQLLIARAIENQCYVIGVNRVGTDGNGYAHSGDSVVIDARGNVISNLKPHEDNSETITLDREALVTFRKNFPVGLDADHFTLNG